MAQRPTHDALKKRISELEKEVRNLKAASDTLRESEQRYRSILNRMEEEYYEVDLGGNFTFFNGAVCRNHGYSPDELMGMNYRDYMSAEAAEGIYRVFSEAYRTGIPAKMVNYEVTRKDGTKRLNEMSVSVMRDAAGVPVGFYGISRDRTELIQTEQALRESEESYRSILALAPDAILIVRAKDGTYVQVNNAFCQMTGYSQDEAIGRTGLDLNLYPDPAERDRLLNALRREGQVDGLEIRFQGKEGDIMDNLVSVRPIRFKGEACLLVMATVITPLKAAQRALRQSEEKYRLLIKNASEGIYITQDGVVKFPNPRTEALTGYSEDELAKMPFLSLVHPKDRDAVHEHQDKEAELGHGSSTYSFRIGNKMGETLWVELNAIAITWEGRPATLNFLRDVTPQKRMEIQLLQARKMEAIGTLAGGIAHDFNNLLMGIQGNTSLMLLDVDTGHPHHQNLKSIEMMVKHGSGLTKQLLGVARGGKYEVKTTDLNQLIEGGADLFARTRKEISIHKRLQENLWPVEVDSGQIEQVLLNLYVNAWHAMPEGGELYIETMNLILDQDKIKPYGLKPVRFVRVSVTDNGVGMDEATLKRVFDPFFTTKEMGRGTGLGLASAYGIIRNHNGLINVYSEKGEGTTFNIYLPASDKQIREHTPSVDAIRGGTETILFVDDEETVLQVGKQLLTRLGYQVIEATNGPAAIEVFAKRREGFHLVILDMIMPGMNGGETYDRLREIDPDVKVLLSSGYSINGQAKKILERGCKGFIQKPYNLRELSKRVRQILDR